MKKHIAVLFVLLTLNLSLMMGCAGNHKLTLPFSELQGSARRTRDVYAPAIIKMIDGFAAMPEIKANEKAISLLNRARPVAVKVQDNAAPLATFLASVVAIDLTNAEEARKLLAAAQSAWDELTPLLNEINVEFAERFVTNEWVRLGIQVAPQAVSLSLSIIRSRIPEQPK